MLSKFKISVPWREECGVWDHGQPCALSPFWSRQTRFSDPAMIRYRRTRGRCFLGALLTSKHATYPDKASEFYLHLRLIRTSSGSLLGLSLCQHLHERPRTAGKPEQFRNNRDGILIIRLVRSSKEKRNLPDEG